MNFRLKIWLLPLTAAAIFVTGSVVSYAVGAGTSNALERLRNAEYPFKEHVDQFALQVDAYRATVQAAVTEGEASRLADAAALAKKAEAELVAIAALPGRGEQAKMLRDALGSYVPAAEAAAHAMLGNGEDPARAMSTMTAAFRLMDERISTAKTNAAEAVNRAQADAARGVDRGLLVLLVTGMAVLAALGTASTLIVRSVWADLGDEPDTLSKLVQRIADGDLVASVTSASRDATPGSLRAALGQMTERLRAAVSGIREGADAIANASAEITDGNADLSARTERASASLQQTASAMEEMTASVGQTAESAAQASDLAQRASDSARRGGHIVEGVVSNMGEITAASQRIGDITGVIDSIAFQTNILALNAAVEAARAGEQGRGFAVVAGEVRTLAQRCARAAREIKDLIAVSAEKIDDGSRLVRDAGGAMQQILSDVQRVVSITAEITTASAEQSRGITGVNQSVTQLDGMTQQNAALVEQSAAAAASLQDQAGRLADTVRGFRLEAP